MIPTVNSLEEFTLHAGTISTMWPNQTEKFLWPFVWDVTQTKNPLVITKKDKYNLVMKA